MVGGKKGRGWGQRRGEVTVIFSAGTRVHGDDETKSYMFHATPNANCCRSKHIFLQNLS